MQIRRVTMKLIIDIPDEIYNDIDSLAKFPTYISPILRDIIKNGNVFSEEPKRQKRGADND